MKTIMVRKPGVLDAQVNGEAPNGPPAPGRVRVKVKYAGVGFADVMAVHGGYPLAPRRPFSPGYEFLGEVTDSGTPAPDAAPHSAPGTRVVGMLPRMGAYREIIDVDPRLVAPVPSGLADEQAALLPLNYLTAYAMIHRLARMSEGQSFLIHGAAGGVGTAALELARILGLKAFGTASRGKHDLVRSLGGVPLDRQDDSWMNELQRRAPHGVDAALDAFGLPSLRKSWRALSPRGILVCYGLSPSIDGGMTDFLKGAAYVGSKKILGGGRRAEFCGTPGIIKSDPAWFQTAMNRILEWTAAGDLKPVLAGIIPWHKVTEAHRRLSEGGMTGKLLLDFSG